MAAAWRRGERLFAEDCLANHPELCRRPEDAVRLIYEEMCLRQECGQPACSTDLVRRFPQWQAELEVVLGCHRLVQARPGPPLFPEVGETLGGFLLLADLGRGALGRVFLAAQTALGDRPVVLKITPRDGREHLSLARLQHTHIVPLYSAEDYADRNLRVLCMPYAGGATLAELLQLLRQQPVRQRAGLDLVAALDQGMAGLPVSLPADGPARKFLARASYVQAVCWIGACLADALSYAHERGLVHLDVKPSNVLLAADGQPMLLDFHLAQKPLQAGAAVPEWLGGTPGYMSPEQGAALTAARQLRPLPSAVDHRTDVYALGLLLYEALGGEVPSLAKGVPARLHRCNPEVSPGLADIVHKCLTHDPHHRYAEAAAVAADLRRHLADLPLRGVANRSLPERWRKWRRRRPYTLAAAGMVLVVLGAAWEAGRSVLVPLSRRFREAETALADGHQQLGKRAYAEAARTLSHGLALAEGVPGSGDLRLALAGGLRSARRGQAAQDLHFLAEQVRFLVDGDGLAPVRARALESRCRAVWDARAGILEHSGTDLEREVEQRIRTDLLDVALLWTDLHVRLAPAREAGEARRRALRVLAQAETLLGPSPALRRERQRHAEALGLPAAAPGDSELQPRTAREHYALGRSLLRSGRFALAAAQLDRAVELQPQGFWPNFYQGVCAYRLRRYEEAVSAFRVCVALAPDSAVCSYNRALAYAALGRADRALHDYDRALKLDPTSSAAALNRGVLHYRQKRYAAAAADLKRALAAGADPAPAHYNLALVHLALEDRSAALANLQCALQHNPAHQQANELQARLLRQRQEGEKP
jgi:serine/threonine protein kinase/tetratricopeptide (TPR) repeat protein